MHSEDLLIYNCCNGQAIEAVCKRLPQLDVIPPLAFVVESVDTIDGSTLMISAQDEEIFWVLYFICK